MPTYEYVCRDCEEHLEVVQSFHEDPLRECGRCGGSLRKVFSAAGIIFKGSGYYVTDTRAAETGNGSKTATKAETSSGESGDSSSGSEGSKGDAKGTDGASSGTGDSKSGDKSAQAPSTSGTTERKTA